MWLVLFDSSPCSRYAVFDQVVQQQLQSAAQEIRRALDAGMVNPPLRLNELLAGNQEVGVSIAKALKQQLAEKPKVSCALLLHLHVLTKCNPLRSFWKRKSCTPGACVFRQRC